MLEFKTEKVNERITRIFAFGTELMYLVEGEKRCALLDTGSGFGHLKKCVDSLTNKPVIVLLTHGHVDHAMGAGEFEEVYMNHEDDYVYVQHAQDSFRLDEKQLAMYECNGKFSKDEYIPPKEIQEIHDLKEGDSFDLGDLHIDVNACAGHTRGSLVFLIREERLLLTGDACNTNTFVFDDYSTTIENYRNNLIDLKRKVDGKFDNILLSHGNGKGYPSLIDDVIDVCTDIMGGRSAEIPMEFKGVHGWIARKDPTFSKGNIVYNKDAIFETKR